MNQKRLFLGCFLSLIATAFGFTVRGAVLADLGKEFNLSQEDLGIIQGVGLAPFALSIILLSLVIDKIGYGRAMTFAFVAHLASAIMTIFANGFMMLYWATFLFALANGTVEAVINPVVATIFDKNKTHWLNILHAGWPGGIVLAGLLAIAVGFFATGEGGTSTWRLQMALLLLPTVLYGVVLFGQKFPVQERVAAGISYMDMLKEFGWGSAYICFALLISGFNQVLVVLGVPALSPAWLFGLAIIPTIAFALWVKSFGRPMFVFLLLVMFLLATTELGTDGWISDIMRSVLQSPTKGLLFLIYTSAIMFVLRFFAGPIVHRISPLGLLAMCAAIASLGLIALSKAGSDVSLLFLAATFYGVGKTFFWPTTLGVVSEQFPRGGALMLNAIAGVGMIAVGAVGAPAIGALQDRDFDRIITAQNPDLRAQVVVEQEGSFGLSATIDQQKLAALAPEQREEVEGFLTQAKQGTLAKIAVMPAIMCICYIGLIIYFQAKGGYQAEVLIGHGADDEKFTGGLKAPMEG